MLRQSSDYAGILTWDDDNGRWFAFKILRNLYFLNVLNNLKFKFIKLNVKNVKKQ